MVTLKRASQVRPLPKEVGSMRQPTRTTYVPWLERGGQLREGEKARAAAHEARVVRTDVEKRAAVESRGGHETIYIHGVRERVGGTEGTGTGAAAVCKVIGVGECECDWAVERVVPESE